MESESREREWVLHSHDITGLTKLGKSKSKTGKSDRMWKLPKSKRIHQCKLFLHYSFFFFSPLFSANHALQNNRHILRHFPGEIKKGKSSLLSIFPLPQWDCPATHRHSRRSTTLPTAATLDSTRSEADSPSSGTLATTTTIATATGPPPPIANSRGRPPPPPDLTCRTGSPARACCGCSRSSRGSPGSTAWS